MTNTEKILAEFEETKAYQYLKVAGFSFEAKAFLTSKIHQALAEERERVDDNFIGMVLRNCEGYTQVAGETRWHLDLESLEKDLQSKAYLQDINKVI